MKYFYDCEFIEDGISIDNSSKVWYTKEEISNKVKEFILDKREDNQLWAYYSAYDHVVLCQLFGKMIDLPDNIPMFTNDLMQLKNDTELPPENDGLHNALEDAKWVKLSYDHIITKGELNG